MQEVIGSTPIFSTLDNQGFMSFHKALFYYSQHTVNTNRNFSQHIKFIKGA